MDGTREDILGKIYEWAETRTEGDGNLFWVHGPPGFGKSCITMSACDWLRERDMLAGSFFCQFDLSVQSDPERILPSLAYTLHLASEKYKKCAMTNLRLYKLTGPDRPSRISHQLETLFVQPFNDLSQSNQGDEETGSQKLFVLVVDGLDEICGPPARLKLAQALRRIANLSSWLKVLVSSRSLPKILDGFGLSPSEEASATSGVVQQDLNGDNTFEDDLRLYIQSRLTTLVKTRRLHRKWLSDDVMNRVMEKANGSFLWVSVAMEYLFYQSLDQTGPTLDRILSTRMEVSPMANLDALYLFILRATTSKGESGTTSGATSSLDFELVANLLAVLRDSKEAMNAKDLHGVLREHIAAVQQDDVQDAVYALQPLLFEDGSLDNAVRMCHASLSDFLGSRERCQEFFVDKMVQV